MVTVGTKDPSTLNKSRSIMDVGDLLFFIAIIFLVIVLSVKAYITGDFDYVLIFLICFLLPMIRSDKK